MMDMSNVSGTTVWPVLGYFYLDHHEYCIILAIRAIVDSMRVPPTITATYQGALVANVSARPNSRVQTWVAGCSLCSIRLAMKVVH